MIAPQQALADLLALCRHWRRGGQTFVAVPICASVFGDFAANSATLTRWIEGKLHAAGAAASAAEITSAIDMLVSDAAREIAPPGEREKSRASEARAIEAADAGPKNPAWTRRKSARERVE